MHWTYTGLDDYQGAKPVTLKDLVRFTGDLVRLPPSVVEVLGQLRRSGDLLGRATVWGGQEGDQKTADIHIKLIRHRYARRYGLNANHDELYEAIEGAGSERLLIRAHIKEIDGPDHRFLALDEEELLPTDGLKEDAYAEEEEAWLLTSDQEMLGEYAEEIYEVLDDWAEEHGERPDPQKLRCVKDKGVLNLQAIEMPPCSTLAQARELAAQLNQALGLDFAVQLAPRHAEQRRSSGNVYENVRDMARRLRGKV